MKHRRLMIAAFMLAAVLTIGIGYAAITGTLGVTGRVEFKGTSSTSSVVNSAVKFDKDYTIEATNCTAAVTGDHAADMNVYFADTNGTVGEVFTATAKYKIVYDAPEGEDLPAIKFSEPVPTITSAAGSPGFGISTDWPAEGVTLNPGEEVFITVTVTYTNQNPVETGTVSAAINVPLPFASVEA